jgi:hypothetical protein
MKIKTYHIRFNTNSNTDEERWRLIEDGVEILVSDIIIDGRTCTTKNWLPEINDYKWHVTCVGSCKIKNNVAYVKAINENSFWYKLFKK